MKISFRRLSRCVWFQKEDRKPRVVLEANFNYWNTARDARLEKVIFLNDISQKEAIEKLCYAEGEVDIGTNVLPVDAGQIKDSPYAKLIAAKSRIFDK